VNDPESGEPGDVGKVDVGLGVLIEAVFVPIIVPEPQ
jgi:hypothetical protein